METLKAALDILINKLHNPSDFRDSLEGLISVYPFNEYEYIIATLLGAGILSNDAYYELRDEYIARSDRLLDAILDAYERQHL